MWRACHKRYGTCTHDLVVPPKRNISPNMSSTSTSTRLDVVPSVEISRRVGKQRVAHRQAKKNAP
jgi:hypothetical protein